MNNQFETIIRTIEAEFQLSDISTENEAEKALLYFLNSRFPNLIIARGHTSTGVRIDLVMDGTYAIELVTVDDESRLISLTHQILKAKDDFLDILVILVDMNKVSPDIIQNYLLVLNKQNIRYIVKKVNIL
jgi:hypothetical protein